MNPTIPFVETPPQTSAAGAVLPAEAASTPTRQILLFEVGGGKFGLWSSVVHEALRAVAISPLPAAPDAVLGVINLRGRAIPVLNLRERFHLPAKEIEVSDHLIVAAAGARVVAFQVDRAVGLVEVPERSIAEAREVTQAAEYVDCVIVMPDGLILIHDPATFLSRSEGRALDAALADR